MARLRFQFVESGELEFPSADRDATVSTDDSAGEVIDASLDELADTFDVEGLPVYATASTRDLLSDSASALEDLRELVDDKTAWVNSLGQLPESLADIEVRLRSLVGLLSVRGKRLRAQLEQSSILNVLRALRRLPTPQPVDGDTFDRQQERANNTSLSGAVRRLMLAETAAFAARADWQTYDDAAGVRDEICQNIDEELAIASDPVYRALLHLRSDVAAVVPGGDPLPRLTTIEVGAVLPSIVLAHRLYGAPDRAEELVARNRVEHPGFMPEGQLEVLVDA